jgi:hypothetical protein
MLTHTFSDRPRCTPCDFTALGASYIRNLPEFRRIRAGDSLVKLWEKALYWKLGVGALVHVVQLLVATHAFLKLCVVNDFACIIINTTDSRPYNIHFEETRALQDREKQFKKSIIFLYYCIQSTPLLANGLARFAQSIPSLHRPLVVAPWRAGAAQPAPTTSLNTLPVSKVSACDSAPVREGPAESCRAGVIQSKRAPMKVISRPR